MTIVETAAEADEMGSAAVEAVCLESEREMVNGRQMIVATRTTTSGVFQCLEIHHLVSLNLNDDH